MPTKKKPSRKSQAASPSRGSESAAEDACPVSPTEEYRLSGPQVEPQSGFWTSCCAPPSRPPTCPPCIVPRPLTLDEIRAGTSIPRYPTDPAIVAAEFEELRDLERRRDDPTQVTNTLPGRERLPISMFLQLRPPPLRGGGTISMARQDSFPVVNTGAELARYFENNTPGLAHRQALNYLIHDTGWSPARQALVWSALDVTIYSALVAAWYYKWLSPPCISRRRRPIEYAIANGFADMDEEDADDQFTVLYDRVPNSTGSGSGVHRPNFPPVLGFINSSPGTPRHPAYPSGHSTYGAAGSALLSFFFPDYKRELDFLADNTGLGRMWAGIHWRSDHTCGGQLGRQVACLIIEQLRVSGIKPVPERGQPTDTPPTREELQAEADAFASNCEPTRPAPAPGLRQPVFRPCVEPGEGERERDVEGQTFVG